jgi:hypothetical protein
VNSSGDPRAVRTASSATLEVSLTDQTENQERGKARAGFI